MELDKMGDWRRSHYSADIGPELDGQEVLVFGWVQEIRDLVFIGTKLQRR